MLPHESEIEQRCLTTLFTLMKNGMRHLNLNWAVFRFVQRSVLLAIPTVYRRSLVVACDPFSFGMTDFDLSFELYSCLECSLT